MRGSQPKEESVKGSQAVGDHKQAQGREKEQGMRQVTCVEQDKEATGVDILN